MDGGPLLDITNLIYRRKSLPSTCCLPKRRLILFWLKLSSPDRVRVTSDGTVHPAIRQSARFGIPLLRSHRHPWLFEWAVAGRTGGSFCPSGARYPGGEQRGAQPAHPPLSDLGGGLCPQSSDPDGMGGEGSS